MIEVVVHHRPIVSPGIAAEQLVASCPAQDDLAELRCKLGGVEIRVGLPDARLFKMPGEAGQSPLHVAGLEHHFVVLGLEQIRHVLGLRALVVAELDARGRTEVEADGKCPHERKLRGGQRRDRT